MLKDDAKYECIVYEQQMYNLTNMINDALVAQNLKVQYQKELKELKELYEEKCVKHESDGTT